MLPPEQMPLSPFGSPTFRGPDDHVFLLIGHQATLYCERGRSAEARQRVRACLDAFLTVARPHLRWMTTPDGKRWEPFEDRRADAFCALLDGPAADTWEMHWHGARYPDETSEFQFEAFGQDRVRGRLSYLRVALPLGAFPESAGAFAALVRYLCQLLLPCHGYGGIAFVESTDPGVKNQAQPTVYALAQRFPGIEVDRPLIHLLRVEGGIKGVNWLTVLGPRFVERMGGTAALRAALPEPFVFHPFDGGLLLQAGPVPQTGDRNQKLWPAFYPELARLLRPIRIKEHPCFDYGVPGRFTAETTMEWLTRFDQDPW
jgi:hypothetical protein